MNYTELKKQLLSDPKVKAEYDALEPEYQFIRDMLACREELSLSQQGLADLTGIDRSDISRIENGTCVPSIQTLELIAKGLGKTLKIEFV